MFLEHDFMMFWVFWLVITLVVLVSVDIALKVWSMTSDEEL